MSTSLIAMLLAQAAPVALPRDPFVSIRATVATTLACERSFDTERRQLADAMKRVDALPQYTAQELELWHKAYAEQRSREGDFKSRRAVACKNESAFERMKAELRKLRPDLSPGEVHVFALGLFHDLRRTAEYAADFSAGYNASQYTPPPAPPPPAKTGS